MQISTHMAEALSAQINLELASSNLYLTMASFFHGQDLDGFAHFFTVQAAEERQHADKQLAYLHQVGGLFTLLDHPKPDQQYASATDVFEKTLAHERKVTKAISELIKKALAEDDYATHTFLQWFITEQVEEEATVQHILAKLRQLGANTSALYLLNAELAQRPFPAAV